MNKKNQNVLIGSPARFEALNPSVVSEGSLAVRSDNSFQTEEAKVFENFQKSLKHLSIQMNQMSFMLNEIQDALKKS